MLSMENKIRGNIVTLSEKLANTDKVLLCLFEKNILSHQEMDSIQRKDHFKGNSELFLCILKRNVDSIWETIKDILQLTSNDHLVHILQPKETPQAVIFKTELPVTEGVALVGSHSLRLNDFDGFEVIGSGVFGSVVKARLKKKDRKYAIKITRQNTHREISCLLRSEHQNIVKFENAWMEKVTENLGQLHYQFEDYIGQTIYCIQMELCNGRDLSAWIMRPPDNKTIEDAKQICFQISLGLQSLHSKNIIHRDLKPANIFLLNSYQMGNDNIIVKIGDLGMSKQTYLESRVSRKSLMTNCGTERYRSPEQEKEGDYDVLTDIFSMGIILLEVLYSTIETKEISIVDSRNGSLPKEFILSFHLEGELIKTMLSNDPNDRPKSDSLADQLNILWYKKAISGHPVLDVNSNSIQIEFHQEEEKQISNLQLFMDDYRDLLSWIKAMTGILSSDKLASNITEAEALLERHNEHRTEMDDRSTTFQAFELFGKQLLESSHHASGQIGELLKSMANAREKLKKQWMDRKMQLDQCLQLHLFYKDCEQTENWIVTRGGFLSEGQEFDNVEVLMTKLEDFDAAIVSQEDKINQLSQFAYQLASSNHYATDSIEIKSRKVLDKFDKLKDAVIEKRYKLQTLMEFSKNASKIENWMAIKLKTIETEKCSDKNQQQKHQEFEVELAANEDRIQAVLTMGRDLIEKKHCEGRENAVEARLDSIAHKWETLSKNEALRYIQLEDTDLKRNLSTFPRQHDISDKTVDVFSDFTLRRE